MQLQPLGRSFSCVFGAALRRVRKSLLVCAPYVTIEGFDFIASHVPRRFWNTGRLQVITNLSVSNILAGVVDPLAIQNLTTVSPDLTIRHLPSLHAKVYVMDELLAIVTSANLTYGGLRGNLEYGVGLRSQDAVRHVADDIQDYGNLGMKISHEFLRDWGDRVRQIQDGLRHRGGFRDRRSEDSPRRRSFVRPRKSYCVCGSPSLPQLEAIRK